MSRASSFPVRRRRNATGNCRCWDAEIWARRRTRRAARRTIGGKRRRPNRALLPDLAAAFHVLLAVLEQLLEHVRAGFLDFAAILAPCLREPLENRAESRPPVASVGRKIRPAEKRLAFRRQPHRHGPSAAAGRRLHEQHVDAIQIGPLFAVDFHRHEVLIQDPRDVFVLERFALHHVAPVAGGVTDREKNRLVFLAGLVERLLAPRIPIHRIVRVLQQVGTFFVKETVGGHSLQCSGAGCLQSCPTRTTI